MDKYKYINLLCLVASFVFFFILCSLQILRRDDYWEIHDAYKFGFPGFIQIEYLNVNGRYFSLFLKSLYQFLPPIPYINTLLILTQLLLVSGCRILIKHIFVEEYRSILFVWSSCLTFAIIFMSSNIWEVWFWGGGTLIYGTGIAFAVMSAALMIENELSEDRKKFYTSAAALCLFCACGTSELITASVCCFTLMILIFPKALFHRKWNKRNGFLTVFTWILTITVLLTSGNFRNAAHFSGKQILDFSAMVHILPQRILDAVVMLTRYTYSRLEYLLIFSFLTFLIGMYSPKAQIPWKVCIPVSVCLLLTGIGVLTINTMIGFTPARVLSIPLDWVCLALMLLMLKTGISLRSRFNRKSELKTTPILTSLVLVTVTGFFFADHIVIVRDIRSAWHRRDQELSALKGSDVPVKTCAIPVLGSAQADPSEDPNQDFNIVTAYYYDFSSITADHLCEPFEKW